MTKKIFILTPQKTASSAVRAALRSAGFKVLRMHTTQHAQRPITPQSPKYETWLRQVADARRFVEELNATPQALLLTIRRQEPTRSLSNIYWIKGELIRDYWDAERQCFDPRMLQEIGPLVDRNRQRVQRFWSHEFEHFDLPNPLTLSSRHFYPRRGDGRFAILDFERIEDDFAWLSRELTGEALPLPRENETDHPEIAAAFKKAWQERASACEPESAPAVHPA